MSIIGICFEMRKEFTVKRPLRGSVEEKDFPVQATITDYRGLIRSNYLHSYSTYRKKDIPTIPFLLDSNQIVVLFTKYT